jgi:hypothetical protein
MLINSFVKPIFAMSRIKTFFTNVTNLFKLIITAILATRKEQKMQKRNQDIRKAKGNIPNWFIAEKIGIHEVTFIRWMRQEMSLNKKGTVLTAIKKAKEELVDDKDIIKKD